MTTTGGANSMAIAHSEELSHDHLEEHARNDSSNEKNPNDQDVSLPVLPNNDSAIPLQVMPEASNHLVVGVISKFIEDSKLVPDNRTGHPNTRTYGYYVAQGTEPLSQFEWLKYAAIVHPSLVTKESAATRVFAPKLVKYSTKLQQNVTIIGTGRSGKNPAAVCIDHVNFKPQLHLLTDLHDAVDANVDTRVLMTHLPPETLAKSVEAYAHDTDCAKVKQENKTIASLREQCGHYADQVEEERRDIRKLENELKLERSALEKERRANHKLSSKLTIAQDDLDEMRQRCTADEEKIESLKHENERLKRHHPGSNVHASTPSCYSPLQASPPPPSFYPQPYYSQPPQLPPNYYPSMPPFGYQPCMPPQYPSPYPGPPSYPSQRFFLL